MKKDLFLQLKEELKEELVSRFGECRFEDFELEDAIDLAIRRGAKGKQIIHEAINFLYY